MTTATGIIISSTLYQSNGVILSVLTPTGIVNAIYKGINRKKTQIHSAETEIGREITITLYHPTRTEILPFIKEISIDLSSVINTTLSPFRMAQMIFICELTRSVIRGEQNDAPLYTLLRTFIELLHTSSDTFLCMRFSYHLCRILGFEPSVTDDFSGKYFDMVEGVFVHSQPLHKFFLTPMNSVLFFSLTDNEKDIVFSNEKDWQKLWHIIMTYFSLHVADFRTPRSLEYLKELTIVEHFH
ncbi:MAG: DNA repair protein RecO C-terminal domain-containing protein [Flavobacteriales bacterium]|nr:DNA repair protein RecO C-terminal domain-containing protein [Flavobacteriales bacterium]